MADSGSPNGVFLPPLIHPLRRIGERSFDFSRQVAVMAIINRTPDSFYDRGRTFALDKAVDSALAAAADGADWVDIGGVPFSPDRPDVSLREELDRVLPVVQAIRAASDIVISVDTFRPEVARQSIETGANVINDTSGLRESAMAEVIAASAATVVIAHSLAPPRTHLRKPQYQDVVGEVASFLRDRVALAQRAGIPLERIVIDPGHDLNKNTYHSLELTRRFNEIANIGLPVLAAVSNKDFIGEALNKEQGERLEGSLAAAVICILQGARIVRMHDIPAAVAAVRLTEAVLGFREPAFVRHNLD
jgi:dihydropteroate synthase